VTLGSSFSVLADALDDVVVEVSRDRHLRYANRAAVRLELGGALDGRSIGTLRGGLGELLRGASLALATAFDLGTPAAFTVSVAGVRYEGRAIPLGNALARRTVLCVARSQRAEQALETSLYVRDARLHALLDAVPDALVLGNAAGMIERVNPAAERLFGYADDDMRGHPLQVLFEGPLGDHADGPDRFGAGALNDGQRRAFAAVGRRRDGTRVPCELLLTTHEAGRERAFIGLIRDVREWQAAGRALQASGDRHRALSRLIGAFAFEYRVEGAGAPVMDWATDTVTSVLGYAVEPFLATPTHTLVHPDDLPAWADALTHARTGAERTVEARFRTATGTYVWLRLLAYALSGDDGQVTRLHVAAQNVTARKMNEAALVEARERAEEAGRLKDAFLSAMSHEIRTPLAAILGFTEVLRLEVPEAARDFIEPIEVGGRRLLETLTAVLELAQLRANAVTLTPERVSVHDVATEVVRAHMPAADAKGLTLAVDVTEGLDAQLDRAAFARVLTNLVGNAVKFTERGSVAVIARADAASFIVRVRDTGVGIDPAFLPHLFEEFRQASSGLTRTHEGTGLGLAVAHLFVNLMGGTIEARSIVGRGTEVDVRLPRVAGGHVAPAAAPDVRPRVLVVEDEAPVRTLLEALLRAHARLHLAGTSTEAILAGVKGAYDVVLLDLDLGERLTGVELRNLLARMPWGPKARFVVVTGTTSLAERERLLGAGFDACVPKPFTRETLLAAAFPDGIPAAADA
jgi:PAS domain S-box-containing protein